VTCQYRKFLPKSKVVCTIWHGTTGTEINEFYLLDGLLSMHRSCDKTSYKIFTDCRTAII